MGFAFVWLKTIVLSVLSSSKSVSIFLSITSRRCSCCFHIFMFCSEKKSHVFLVYFECFFYCFRLFLQSFFHGIMPTILTFHFYGGILHFHFFLIQLLDYRFPNHLHPFPNHLLPFPLHILNDNSITLKHKISVQTPSWYKIGAVFLSSPLNHSPNKWPNKNHRCFRQVLLWLP